MIAMKPKFSRLICSRQQKDYVKKYVKEIRLKMTAHLEPAPLIRKVTRKDNLKSFVLKDLKIVKEIDNEMSESSEFISRIEVH